MTNPTHTAYLILVTDTVKHVTFYEIYSEPMPSPIANYTMLLIDKVESSSFASAKQILLGKWNL